jgi:hypothetical protein
MGNSAVAQARFEYDQYRAGHGIGTGRGDAAATGHEGFDDGLEAGAAAKAPDPKPSAARNAVMNRLNKHGVRIFRRYAGAKEISRPKPSAIAAPRGRHRVFGAPAATVLGGSDRMSTLSNGIRQPIAGMFADDSGGTVF